MVSIILKFAFLCKLCYNIFIILLAMTSFRRFIQMLLKNRAPTRRIFSSLRRRSTVQNKQESHEHESRDQQAVYENADKLLECFIIPNLIRRATSPCHPNPYPTLRINRLGSHYFYQIGEYEHFIPSDFVLDDEIIRTALKCAPSRGLVVDRREVTFSMYIE